MSIDVDEVIGALKRDRLSLLVGGEPTSIPAWFDWLLWLGQWMRVQVDLDGRRVAVVRMPSRRLGAAAIALGSVFASARLHDDSLDWKGLQSLHPGTKIFWRETASGRSTRRSGTVAGLRQIAGSDFIEVVVQAQKSTRLFAKSAALSYGITLGSVSAEADERLASAESVIRVATTDVAQGWMRSPAIECTIITERTSFLSDLDGVVIRAGAGAGAGAEAPWSDLLAIADSGSRSHGKTRVAPARRDGILDESGSITILDGASAAARMGDTIASSVVVLLDQSEYDEEVEQLIQTFLGFADDAHIHAPANGVKASPASIEAFIFGLPLQSRSQT